MKLPKPGELRAAKILETLEKQFKRPETRFDAQKMLGKLSAQGQVYAKHLVMSGPDSSEVMAKACDLTAEQLEAVLVEIEAGLKIVRRKSDD